VRIEMLASVKKKNLFMSIPLIVLRWWVCVQNICCTTRKRTMP